MESHDTQRFDIHASTLMDAREFNYHVLLDGQADNDATPYRGDKGGLDSAIQEAFAIKRGNPNADVAIRISFPD